MRGAVDKTLTDRCALYMVLFVHYGFTPRDHFWVRAVLQRMLLSVHILDVRSLVADGLYAHIWYRLGLFNRRGGRQIVSLLIKFIINDALCIVLQVRAVNLTRLIHGAIDPLLALEWCRVYMLYEVYDIVVTSHGLALERTLLLHSKSHD